MARLQRTSRGTGSGFSDLRPGHATVGLCTVLAALTLGCGRTGTTTSTIGSPEPSVPGAQQPPQPSPVSTASDPPVVPTPSATPAPLPAPSPSPIGLDGHPAAATRVIAHLGGPGDQILLGFGADTAARMTALVGNTFGLAAPTPAEVVPSADLVRIGADGGVMWRKHAHADGEVADALRVGADGSLFVHVWGAPVQGAYLEPRFPRVDRWSPDGDFIETVARCTNDCNVYVPAANGSRTLTQMTSDTGGSVQLWAHGGQRLWAVRDDISSGVNNFVGALGDTGRAILGGIAHGPATFLGAEIAATAGGSPSVASVAGDGTAEWVRTLGQLQGSVTSVAVRDDISVVAATGQFAGATMVAGAALSGSAAWAYLRPWFLMALDGSGRDLWARQLGVEGTAVAVGFDGGVAVLVSPWTPCQQPALLLFDGRGEVTAAASLPFVCWGSTTNLTWRSQIAAAPAGGFFAAGSFIGKAELGDVSLVADGIDTFIVAITPPAD